jgi:hypothetical protein
MSEPAQYLRIIYAKQNVWDICFFPLLRIFHDYNVLAKLSRLISLNSCNNLCRITLPNNVTVRRERQQRYLPHTVE